MTIPYLHNKETRLLKQVRSDLIRQENYREFAYPDVLSPIGRKYRGKDWPWGFVPARTLLAKIPENERDGVPWTVGIGFTLGVTPDTRMPRQQAERLLDDKIFEYRDYARRLVGNFNEQPFVVQTVLINMAFNLGYQRLGQFVNTLRAVREKRYQDAARGMRASLWFRQVGSRAVELSDRMETLTIREEHLAR